MRLPISPPNIDNLTRADLYNRNLELAVFLRPELTLAEENKSVPCIPPLFLNPEHIPHLKEELLNLVKAAASGTGFSFNASHLTVIVGEHGISYGVRYEAVVDEAAQIEHAELMLSQLIAERWGYVGFCNPKKHGCGRYFLKSRIDREFCSKTCLNRSTTYRQRGKEPKA